MGVPRWCRSGAAYFYQKWNQTKSLVQAGSSDDSRESPGELSFSEGGACG